jgi:hypothetical protein
MKGWRTREKSDYDRRRGERGKKTKWRKEYSPLNRLPIEKDIESGNVLAFPKVAATYGTGFTGVYFSSSLTAASTSVAEGPVVEDSPDWIKCSKITKGDWEGWLDRIRRDEVGKEKANGEDERKGARKEETGGGDGMKRNG